VFEYKYGKYNEADEECRRKMQVDKKETELDDIQKGDGRWEEIKENKETLAIYNHKKASVHYLEVANQLSIR
jgi:hypothetical protein